MPANTGNWAVILRREGEFVGSKIYLYIKSGELAWTTLKTSMMAAGLTMDGKKISSNLSQACKRLTTEIIPEYESLSPGGVSLSCPDKWFTYEEILWDLVNNNVVSTEFVEQELAKFCVKRAPGPKSPLLEEICAEKEEENYASLEQKFLVEKNVQDTCEDQYKEDSLLTQNSFLGNEDDFSEVGHVSREEYEELKSNYFALQSKYNGLLEERSSKGPAEKKLKLDEDNISLVVSKVVASVSTNMDEKLQALEKKVVCKPWMTEMKNYVKDSHASLCKCINGVKILIEKPKINTDITVSKIETSISETKALINERYQVQKLYRGKN